MATVRLIQNIAGSLSRSNVVKVGLSDSINMYPETQSPTEHSTQLMMRSVSGARGFSGHLDGACRGLYRVSRGLNNEPVLYGVFGNVVYLFDSDGTAHNIQRIETASSECRMVETGGYGDAHPHLVIVDGVNCYAVDTTLNVVDQRADFRIIELPIRGTDEFQRIEPTHITYLFGYLICNDRGTDAFYTSIQYPFETTTADNQIDYDIWRLGTTNNVGYITYSEWCPDNTTALCSNGSRLWTFGPRSWQCFSYNNDKRIPFTSPDNAAGNVGIKAPNSLAMLGQTVIWLGSSDIGEDGVFMIRDNSLVRVSTGDLERELTLMTNPENAYACIWQEHRHTFYALTFQDSKMTYVYDVSEDKWHRRASYDRDNRLTYWRYGHACFAYNRTMVADGSDLCYLDENTFEEHDGTPILKLRRGGVLTSTDQPFYIDSAEIICNNGQQSSDLYNLVDGKAKAQPDAGLNPRIQIRYSWDGATFSDYEDYFLGRVGNYDWSTTAWSLGCGKFFTLEISTSEKVPFCIQSLKIAFSPTSNFI